MSSKTNKYKFTFVGGSLFIILLFTVVPLLYSLVLSFQVGRGSQLSYDGFANYERLFSDTIILFACTFATIPYILIILSSFNTSVDIKKGDIFTNFNFTNFRTNFINLTADGNFVTSLINSIIVSVLTVVIGVFLASLAGYAYVMYKNKTMNRLFSLSFFSIMIPSSVIVIPLFMMLRFMNLLDSLFSVILVSLSLPFLIYLFRQNTKMFPRELIKIARVDGLSEFSIYWRIYLPNMKAVFVTASLILFIDTWNSLLYPLVIIQSQKNMMLSVYINSIGSSRTSDYGAFMIALLISTIPILILFVAVQKQFRSGMRTM